MVPLKNGTSSIDLYGSAPPGKGPMPDFNNGPRITQIVVAFLSPGIYSRQTRIMTPPQTISILVRWKILLWLSSRNFFQGVKSIVMQISFVMLLFLDQISGTSKSFRGANCLRGRPPAPVEESHLLFSLPH